MSGPCVRSLATPSNQLFYVMAVLDTAIQGRKHTWLWMAGLNPAMKERMFGSACNSMVRCLVRNSATAQLPSW